MKTIFLYTFIFLVALASKAQTNQNLSNVIERVSEQWKKDSNSCKGYRQKVVKDILKCQIDAVNKNQIFLQLGKPNQTQKFYRGNTDKNYVGYIYYVYIDNCPKITVDGYAIQFVFAESENTLLEITEINYCGYCAWHGFSAMLAFRIYPGRRVRGSTAVPVYEQNPTV
ncbi:MAG: hypothetical protein WDO16_09020 [Bacteroidota bacterium]